MLNKVLYKHSERVLLLCVVVVGHVLLLRFRKVVCHNRTNDLRATGAELLYEVSAPALVTATDVCPYQSPSLPPRTLVLGPSTRPSSPHVRARTCEHFYLQCVNAGFCL
jgi:hypothetical protein